MWLQKLRNLVKMGRLSKVSKMSFEKNITQYAELETQNSFWKLG